MLVLERAALFILFGAISFVAGYRCAQWRIRREPVVTFGYIDGLLEAAHVCRSFAEEVSRAQSHIMARACISFAASAEECADRIDIQVKKIEPMGKRWMRPKDVPLERWHG